MGQNVSYSSHFIVNSSIRKPPGMFQHRKYCHNQEGNPGSNCTRGDEAKCK